MTVRRVLVRVRREERGQASFEFLGMLPYLLLAAFAGWQLMLGAWTYTQAANAARTASRVEGRGGDGERAAKDAVTGVLRRGMVVDTKPNNRVTVKVRIPIVLPGLSSAKLRATRTAELPG